MGYMDFVERGIEVKFSGKLKFNDLYKEITRWGKHHQYNIDEKKYEISKGEEGQNTKIVLELNKKVSDYAKISIIVALIGTELKNIKQKNKIIQEGDVLVVLNNFIKRDYEDVWTRKNLYRFIREFYDRFIGNSRYEIDEKLLKKETRDLRNTIKDHFKAPKLKK